MDKKSLISYLNDQGFQEEIVAAFNNVKRENFIPEKYILNAYEDRPLPIGKTSTISQPSTIAFMLELLDLKKHMKILEIGSGSGYVLALISNILKKCELIGLEIDEELCKSSQKLLAPDKKIRIFCQDGKEGCLECAPFDRILISASCPHSPYYLLTELKEKGIIVASVKNSIVKITKDGKQVTERDYPGFSFVPLL